MFEFVVIATGLVSASLGLYAFSRARDATHPATFTSPLFLFFYCVWPLIINRPGGLPDYFTIAELEYVSVMYLLSIGALYLGMINFPKGVPHRGELQRLRQNSLFAIQLTPSVRKRLFTLGVFLGIIAIAAYWYSIVNTGGFVDAFSRPKGGGRVASGYVGEAPLLGYPAIALVALARQRRRFRLADMVLVLLLASPHLIQGVFGGRRGPLFLILAMLFIAWFIFRGTRPSLKQGVIGVGVVSIAVLLVWSQRQYLYLGSGGEFEISRVMERVDPDDIGTGDEYLAGVATVITADEVDNFYWGYRYFVTFVIRPIPRQLWPTKYEDVGADWLYRYGDDEREERYLHAVGFTLLAGSSTGYVADVYYEFAWGVVLVSFLLGRLLSMLWTRHRTRGGLWTILFLEALILSIYLPTQSLTAFMHRMLFMGITTYLAWRYWIQPVVRKSSIAVAGRRDRYSDRSAMEKHRTELE